MTKLYRLNEINQQLITLKEKTALKAYFGQILSTFFLFSAKSMKLASSKHVAIAVSNSTVDKFWLVWSAATCIEQASMNTTSNKIFNFVRRRGISVGRQLAGN